LLLPSTLKTGFKESYGKFPVAYGNVVILDCHYILDNLLEAAIVYIKPMQKQNPLRYAQILAAIKGVEAVIDTKGITMCDVTPELDGVLTDQNTYYLQEKEEIQASILDMGQEIVIATTRASNYTMTAPLMDSYSLTLILLIWMQP
jgi:hypothetical protein